MNRLLFLPVLLGCLGSVPAVAQSADGPVALTGCTIHTITNGTIENGTIVLRDGLIAAVGSRAAVPDDARTIDCAGDHVYPGFIDGGTQIGLVEIGSLEETNDDVELGEVRPHMRALTAVNPSTVHIPTTRVSGVTHALTMPSNRLFPGTAALIRLHGYTPAQLDAGFEAVVLNFPVSGRRGSSDRRSAERIRRADREAIEELDEVWEQAKLYARIDSAYRAAPDPERIPLYNPAMRALLPVVRGEMPLLVEVNNAADIKTALAWVRERQIRAVFTGVREGWRVAEELATAGVPVIVGPVIALPTRAYDRYDKPYANPGLLARAGVKVALRTGASNTSPGGRNLPYQAGFAAAYGMERDAALRAVTIHPAQIFGVDDRLGSLEPGKSATLFLADGDPFEPSTTVRRVFIDGYDIPMTDRQRELYEEFLERDPGLER